jgi:hypothetical protein
MSMPTLRSAVVLVLCGSWVFACGGSAFNAGGSAAGSSGTVATGGGSSAGASSGGSSQAGGSPGGTAGSAGTPQGGAPQGGAPGDSGGAPSAGAPSAGAGGALVRNSGDCDVDKDCPSGGKCVALSVDGFRTCVVPVPLATTCTGVSQCCAGSKPCAAGVDCVDGPLAPSCGLVSAAGNVCATPACTLNTDCTGNNAICVPAGSLDRKANTCLTGACRRDADCKDAAGGKCEPVTPACCGGPSGLYCVYPGTGCRSAADCAAGSSCVIVNQKTGTCQVGGVACAE